MWSFRLIKYLSYTILSLIISLTVLSNLTYARSSNTKSSVKISTLNKASRILPQIEIFESHVGISKNYVIALDPIHPGATLITYNSPTCQANTHGNTILNHHDPSKLEFTAKEDPYCKISMQITKNHQLKILSETIPCSTWHGDFCSFETLPIVNRIYPITIKENISSSKSKEKGQPK